MKAAIVTGPMRSGGSAVAEMLNEMGVPMGVQFMAPIPPVLRTEWEDVDLATYLMAGDVGQRDLAEYWLERVKRAQLVVPGVEAIGIKSPFIALHLEAVVDSAREAGLEPVVLRTYRDPQTLARSFREHVLAFLPAEERERWTRWQNEIIGAATGAHLVVNYDDMIERPLIWARRVSSAVFGRWVDNVEESALKIKEPVWVH